MTDRKSPDTLADTDLDLATGGFKAAFSDLIVSSFQMTTDIEASGVPGSSVVQASGVPGTPKTADNLPPEQVSFYYNKIAF